MWLIFKWDSRLGFRIVIASSDWKEYPEGRLHLEDLTFLLLLDVDEDYGQPEFAKPAVNNPEVESLKKNYQKRIVASLRWCFRLC